MVAFICL